MTRIEKICNNEDQNVFLLNLLRWNEVNFTDN